MDNTNVDWLRRRWWSGLIGVMAISPDMYAARREDFCKDHDITVEQFNELGVGKVNPFAKGAPDGR